MEIVQKIHSLSLPNELIRTIPILSLTPTLLALFSLILFLYSLITAFKNKEDNIFIFLLRSNWLFITFPSITGLIMALSGKKVGSSTAYNPEMLGEACIKYAVSNNLIDVSKYCLPIDPARNLEHWMYVFFSFLSLILIEVLVKKKWNGEFLSIQLGWKLLPVITLFYYGCVYMIGRVAFLPGNSILEMLHH